MRSSLKIFVFSMLALFYSASCTKEENKLYYQDGTAPALTATNVADAASFGYANAANTAITLNWTNPEYTFNTGVNSLDVTYVIQIDTVGSNFTNPGKKEIQVSKILTKTFSISELNDIMLNNLNLAVGTEHFLEMRVISSLTNGQPPLVSNVVQYPGVIAYAIPPKVTPPSTGTLYITGSASPASWQCGCGEAAPADQTFTQVSPTLYELTVNLTGGGSYLLLPRYGTWNAVDPDPNKYGFNGSNNKNDPNGGEFKAGGGDILAPSASGSYKIIVDFQKGLFTVTKQ